MTSKTKYTFIPLPLIERDPCMCWKPVLLKALQPVQPLDVHAYPYQTLPPLECHILSPFTIVNAGPKCAGIDLDVITCECCQTHKAQQVLKYQLELLCEIWELCENAKGDTKEWEQEKRGKRKREDKGEDIEWLLQLS